MLICIQNSDFNLYFSDENIESNEIAAILGGLTGVVVLIIIILSGMIYYKMKVKKNGYVFIIKHMYVTTTIDSITILMFLSFSKIVVFQT